MLHDGTDVDSRQPRSLARFLYPLVSAKARRRQRLRNIRQDPNPCVGTHAQEPSETRERPARQRTQVRRSFFFNHPPTLHLNKLQLRVKFAELDARPGTARRWAGPQTINSWRGAIHTSTKRKFDFRSEIWRALGGISTEPRCRNGHRGKTSEGGHGEVEIPSL